MTRVPWRKSPVTESLPFTAAVADSIPEAEIISMVDQEQRNDDVEIQSSYDSGTIQQEVVNIDGQ